MNRNDKIMRKHYAWREAEAARLKAENEKQAKKKSKEGKKDGSSK